MINIYIYIFFFFVDQISARRWYLLERGNKYVDESVLFLIFSRRISHFTWIIRVFVTCHSGTKADDDSKICSVLNISAKYSEDFFFFSFSKYSRKKYHTIYSSSRQRCYVIRLFFLTHQFLNAIFIAIFAIINSDWLETYDNNINKVQDT